MSLSKAAIPIHNPELVWRPLDDELVIVRPSDGQIRVLNGVGSFIWQAVDGKRSTADVAYLVCSEYEVSPEEALADVIEFLDKLSQDELVTW